MELEITQAQRDGFKEITARHKGKELVFVTKPFVRVRLVGNLGPFWEINQYWQWAGETVQDHVWECYRRLHDILENVMEIFPMETQMTAVVAEMYQAMPLDSFYQWLTTQGRLYIPGTDEVPIEISSSISAFNRERTYVRSDYIDLAVLSLALRPMVPIWGDYISQMEQGGANGLYKEVDAMALVSLTELVNNPAADKLYRYVEIKTNRTELPLSFTWRGLSKNEVPEWLFAKVMVRRLTIVPLSDFTEKHSIVANIYHHIDSKLNPNDQSGPGRIKPKLDTSEGAGTDEEDKTSLLELYKVKKRLPDGDVVLYEEYLSNMAMVAQNIDPTIDLNLLERTTQDMDRLKSLPINYHQLRLTQWVMAVGSDPISPRALEHVNHGMNNALVTAQALLWHWGFYTTACLMQVEAASVSNVDAPFITTGRPRRSRIKPHHKEALERLYPHTKPQRSRDNNNTFNGNVGGIGIKTVTDAILSGNWKYLGPPELKALAGQPEERPVLVLSPEIKNEVTELVISIAEKRQ